MKTKTVLTKIQSLASKKGFTLIELLVVIAIIAVLIAVGLAAFGTAQKNTRDSRRKADLKNIQAAMEQYYGTNSNAYPASIGSISNVTYFQNGVLPTDPKGGATYWYDVLSTTNYCACATLENQTQGNYSSRDCSAVGSSSYYCVRNSQ